MIVAGLLAVTIIGCKDKTPSPTALSAPAEPAAAVSTKTVPQPDEFAPGIAYTNYRYADVPWSVQVVRVDRGNAQLEMHSVHAQHTVCGMSTLSEVVNSIPGEKGEPLAGVNGDFFLRDRAYAGDPRGLQIVDGDMVSGPSGGAAFWLDAQGQPRAEEVRSEMKVTWPNGSSTPIGLNEPRRPDGAVLFTASLGRSTFTADGIEFVLEKAGNGSWYPLQAGETLKARVKEIRGTPNTQLNPKIMVLSVGPALAARLGRFKAGAELQISTATIPDLRGAETAIGGGPVLLRGGKVVEIERPKSLMAVPYSIRSMFERHPRTAMGWNDQYFYLVQIDGRQRDLSMGMTLAELSEFMRTKLGCTDAMNLDGGGSSTFWANGRTLNNPCEGHERELANALLVLRKPGGVARTPARPGTAHGG